MADPAGRTGGRRCASAAEEHQAEKSCKAKTEMTRKQGGRGGGLLWYVFADMIGIVRL